jgi:MerR family transcriptional regulator/heat shock protein HspR
VDFFHGPDEPVYTIGVAARLLGETPQFLRQIENEGLISPARTDSNIRLYSSNDLKLLARIIYLWRQCGINPQGIRVIIAMEEGDSQIRTHVSRRPQDSPGAAKQDRHSGDASEAKNGLVRETR